MVSFVMCWFAFIKTIRRDVIRSYISKKGISRRKCMSVIECDYTI